MKGKIHLYNGMMSTGLCIQSMWAGNVFASLGFGVAAAYIFLFYWAIYIELKGNSHEQNH
jgi:hypothetical protein